MSGHTAGPWRMGDNHGSIVSDSSTNDPGYDKPDHVEAYNGYLIAESVLPQNRPIIAAAPEMLSALEAAEEWMAGMVPANSYGLRDRDADKEREAALVIIRAAIAKAKSC